MTYSAFGSAVWHSYLREMSVLEAVVVLETVSYRMVQADMARPYQCSRKPEAAGQDQTDQRESHRPGQRVSNVIYPRSNAGTDKIAQHKDIGRKKERDKNPPGKFEVDIQGQAGNE